METIAVNLIVPKGWNELNDKQLLFVYRLLADGLPSVDIRTKCLLKWSDTHVMGVGSGETTFLLKHRGKTFDVPATQVAEVISLMAWLDDLPTFPVRPSHFKRHRPLPADFSGVPFEKFLVCDNLYQGYLTTKDEHLLDEMGKVLYDCKVKAFPSHFRIAFFYWFAALKQYLSNTFPNFYRPAKSEDSNMLGSPTQNVAEAMNAQIRALTKGDVTKEKEILSLDTWRALTELNAQAKEYEELQQKYPTK
ncbi:hypothetical protein [Sodaliphilus sp.]|uniref:hypothetical protein n=1 Tax=Sodaliphilus sp. TaxID=2815818 RepID=UPI00388DEF52